MDICLGLIQTLEAQIRIKAVEILRNRQEGARYSQLINELHQADPGWNINTIRGAIWDLDVTMSGEVYKPDRGLFRHISFKTSEPVQPMQEMAGRVREVDFYGPFADYLKNELGECNIVKSLGGNQFGDRWATPDVMGVWRTTRTDPIKGEEIVSAEIKLDMSTSSLITAFGQACAYRLFSHKVYLVIPTKSNEEDKMRIEGLCSLHGIGLVYFDSANTGNPQFKIRVSAVKHEPDLYYVNYYMRSVPELF